MWVILFIRCKQLLTGNQSCHLMSMWYINAVVIPRLFVLLNCCPIWCRYNGLFTNQLQHSPPWKFPCRHPAWGFPWTLVCSLGESTLLVRAALQPIKVAWRPSNPQTKQFYSTNEARSAVLRAMCWMCVAKWLEVLRYFKTVKFTWHQNVVRSFKIREVNWRYDTKWTYAYVPRYFAKKKWKTERDARCLKNKAVARLFTTFGTFGPWSLLSRVEPESWVLPLSPATWNKRQHGHSYDEGIQRHTKSEKTEGWNLCLEWA